MQHIYGLSDYLFALTTANTLFAICSSQDVQYWNGNKKLLIHFQDWDRQSPSQVITELCGFVTILSGTFLLHKTKDMVDGMLLILFYWNICWQRHFWPYPTFIVQCLQVIYENFEITFVMFKILIAFTRLVFYFESNIQFSNLTGISTSSPIRLTKHMEEDEYNGLEGIPLRRQEATRLP